MLKFAQDVEMNHVREKRKSWLKLSSKLFKGKDGYDPLIEISPFPGLIHLKNYLGGINHCVTVVGKCIFDSNFTLPFPITRDDLDYCCINYNETKIINGYQVVLKSIMFFQQIKIQVSFRSKNSCILFDYINMF